MFGRLRFAVVALTFWRLLATPVQVTYVHECLYCLCSTYHRIDTYAGSPSIVLHFSELQNYCFLYITIFRRERSQLGVFVLMLYVESSQRSCATLTASSLPSQMRSDGFSPTIIIILSMATGATPSVRLIATLLTKNIAIRDTPPVVLYVRSLAAFQNGGYPRRWDDSPNV